MKFLKARKALIETALRMNASGINQGTSGNLSQRVPAGLLITPSGVPYGEMAPADVVFMDMAGTWQCERQGRRPSSEWRFHLDILTARPEVNAIVHCHSQKATALACLRQGIPAFHYMVAIAGGDDIRCAPYETFGSQALSQAALDALADRWACLLANHGQIALGRDLRQALALAIEVEVLAEQFCTAQSLQMYLGRPKILSKKEMVKVLAKFQAGAGYASDASDNPKRKNP
ncbi:MAG: class II aldolase/adducin family protein [Pseudomonadota bacterium]